MPFADLGDVRLHYHSVGQGIPLLFVHPPLMTSRLFHYQRMELSDRFRVVTVDLRGHGLSSHASESFSYPLLVQDLCRFAQKLNLEDAYLCGYSAGGSLILEALLERPGMFRGGILISTMPEVIDPILKNSLRLISKLVHPMLLKPLTACFAFRNADSWLTFQNLYRHGLQGDPASILQYFRCSEEYRCSDRLTQIKKPLLVIHGGKDRFFKRYADLLQTHLPHASHMAFENASHHIPTKAASQLHDAIRQWIQQTEEQRKAPIG